MKDRQDFLQLFGHERATLRHFTVLKKQGHPILYLPDARRMADATLRLYPAQRVFARSLVALVRGFMRMGIPVSREGADFLIDEDAAFPDFLAKLLPGGETVPEFGILANRFKDSGRPYVLLVFDGDNRPAVVVKVGTTPEARRLIRVEQDLFFSLRPDFPYLPEALDKFEGDDASAIAYRYIEGANPRPRQYGKIGPLLNSWISEEEPARLNDLPIWSRLEVLQRDNPGLEPIIEALLNCRVKPVLSHGDFAPWNVRVTSSEADSEWIVLDWEQGSRRGVPGWDWIHFIVQYSTLVRHLSAHSTLSEIENLWKNAEFQAYAHRTGIASVIKELTFLFLFYFVHYCHPRENAVVARELLSEFNYKYFGEIVPALAPFKSKLVIPEKLAAYLVDDL